MRWTSILSLCFAAVLAAQTQVPVKPAPAPATPRPVKLGSVVVTGSFRSRVEGWDWFQPDSGDNTYAYSGNLFRVGFSRSHETWDWNAEFAVPIVLGLPGNPLGPGAQGALGLGANYFTSNGRSQNTAMIFPKQLYARFSPFGAKSGSLKLGRFEFNDGAEVAPKNATLATIKASRINQRLIGTFGFTHVGRSFDGTQYLLTKPSGTFAFVGAMPTRGVFQTDGWGWNNTAFGYAGYTKSWGTGRHAAETRAFGIFYDDWRRVLKTDNRALAVRRSDLDNLKIGTFGGHSIHAFTLRPGIVDIVAWGSAQTGKWGRLNQRAYALDAEAGIQPAHWKGRPWFRGGYYYGSGDGNPNDRTNNTFFQMMPTPRLYAKTPFFNMMNNRDAFGIVMLRPHAKVTMTGEFHATSLADRNDLWYAGGGVYQPWTFGFAGRSTNGRRSLANLYDAGFDYRFSPHITLSPYFGYMQGRAAIATIYPKGTNGSFGYLEVTYRF